MGQLAEHPKGSTVRTDEQGSYVAYHKVCHNCQVELTSRSRAGCGSLKCMACIATSARDRLRVATGWPNQKMGRPRKPTLEVAPIDKPPLAESPLVSVTRSERDVGLHHSVSPERQKMHSMLTKFLMHPTSRAAKEELLDGLVSFELKERFRSL